jgi:glycine cleavage system H protein
MNVPSNLKYTKDHEWIVCDGDLATIGITAYAVEQLGDIVFVDIDTVGEELASEEVFGTIEAVKTVSDLYIPISGEVLEFNTELEGNPGLINSDPYNAGWIIKVKVANIEEFSHLLSPEDYIEIIK